LSSLNIAISIDVEPHFTENAEKEALKSAFERIA
jgi:hypothetical protein